MKEMIRRNKPGFQKPEANLLRNERNCGHDVQAPYPGHPEGCWRVAVKPARLYYHEIHGGHR